MNEDWARGSEEILGEVVKNRSGYGGRLENLGGFSDLGYEVTYFDEAIQKKIDGISYVSRHTTEYERDAHCSIQSRNLDS